jgi:hypothetical protein
LSEWQAEWSRWGYAFMAVMAVIFLWNILQTLKAISKQLAILIYHLKGWDTRDLD